MKKRLGRGLDAFITKPASASDAAAESSPERGELRKIPIEWLKPGQYQPRKIMTDEALEELSHSIKAQGVIQPIVVRSVATDRFEIIAGERRWRAAQMAGLDQVPCLVKEVPDEAAIAMALIENIQREDLNAIEEAAALQRLMTEFGLTHLQTAEAVGKSRTTVTNLLRLLSLTDECKTLLERGDLEMGHARALLSLDGERQTTAARNIVAKGMTVREAERLVRKLNEPKPEKKAAQPSKDVARLEQKLGDYFAAQVQLQQGKGGKGKLVLSYSSLDELDGLLQKMGFKDEL